VSADPTEIAEALSAAFSKLEPPAPPVTIGNGPIEQTVESVLAGREADDLTPEDALAIRLDLWTLTPEAFAYYVPALARMLLADKMAVDALGEGLWTALAPPTEPGRREKFDARIAVLDDDQRAAIGRFVCWYLCSEEELPRADEARGYWNC
jgi:hypothetical protein